MGLRPFVLGAVLSALHDSILRVDSEDTLSTGSKNLEIPVRKR